jgi:hypothetical protein
LDLGNSLSKHCKPHTLGVGSDEPHPCPLPISILREAGTISEDTGASHPEEEDASHVT